VFAERTRAGAAPSDVSGEDRISGPDDDMLAAALERIPGLRGRPYVASRLEGGLTNRSYRLDVADGHAIVVRLSGKSSLLAIDRQAECHNATAAAGVGVGPAVLLCEPGFGVAAFAWIDGRTLEDDDLHDPAVLERVAALCRRLHAGPRFATDFDMFEIQARYRGVVRDEGFRLPPNYDSFVDQVGLIRTALTARPMPTVPCHNDLLAANILDDGSRLWFIDYEYAGNNDPCFELGNIWSEAALEPELLDVLVDAYFGRHSPALIARARLLALMAKYGWALWAAIQDGVSAVDFDFWSWGMEKYERAVAEFEAPVFHRLLQDVRQSI
jgi:thiamine kinase-like enzyme